MLKAISNLWCCEDRWYRLKKGKRNPEMKAPWWSREEIILAGNPFSGVRLQNTESRCAARPSTGSMRRVLGQLDGAEAVLNIRRFSLGGEADRAFWLCFLAKNSDIDEFCDVLLPPYESSCDGDTCVVILFWWRQRREPTERFWIAGLVCHHCTVKCFFFPMCKINETCKTDFLVLSALFSRPEILFISFYRVDTKNKKSPFKRFCDIGERDMAGRTHVLKHTWAYCMHRQIYGDEFAK